MNLNRIGNSRRPEGNSSTDKTGKLKEQLKAVRQKQLRKPKPAPEPKDCFAESKFGGRMLKTTPSKPSQSKPLQPKKKWTVLTYLAGDCNLEEYGIEDLLDMQKVGSSRDMNLVVQIDRPGAEAEQGKGDNRLTAGRARAAGSQKPKAEKTESVTVAKYGGKPGATRYYIQKSVDNTRIHSPELEHLGRTDMSNPKVFKDFLAWGMESFPADNYLVVALGHGGGVMGMSTDEGGAHDFPEKDDIISPPDFKKAFKMAEEQAGVNKDQVLIGLKSCQMGQVEFADELQDVASILLASQSVVYTDNWRLDDILGQKGIAEYDIPQMAGHIFEVNKTARVDKLKQPLNPYLVNKFQTQGVVKKKISTGAKIDLQAMPQLEKALGKFEQALKTTSTPPEKLKQILEIKSRPGYLINSWVVNYASDFYQIAREIMKDPQIQDPALKKATRNLISSLDKVVLDSTNRGDLAFGRNSNGIGITTASNRQVYEKLSGLPAHKTTTYEKSAYHSLKMDKDSGWSDFLTAYSRGVSLEKMDAVLPDTQFKYPQLKDFSQTAREDLETLNNLDAENLEGNRAEKVKNYQAELKQIEKDIAKINAQPKLTERAKGEKVDEELARFSTLSKLRRINNRVISSPNKEIMDWVLKRLITRSADPKQLPEVLKTGMAVISALEGEISAKTLSQAAKNVLEAGKTAKNSGQNEMIGAELITILGYATQNQKMINVRNYHGENPKEFLKQMAELKSSKAE